VKRDDSPTAVLFDAGGTLIESAPPAADVYARVFSHWGVSVSGEDVRPVFTAVWTELTQEQPTGLDRYHVLKGGEEAWWGEFLRRVLSRMGLGIPWEPVLAELFSAFADAAAWHVFPEVCEVLTAMRGRDLSLGVVSNWDSRLPALLERLGLAGFFDVVLVSALEGVEKPEPAIFLRAVERLGAHPGSCLHVGDSPLDDYRGAESAGLRAVLLDRHGLFADGYSRISDLRGLDAYLA
jgi:putative hydrolase of the HAD superfamily